MPATAIFILYLGLCCLILIKLPFVKKANLGTPVIILLFGIKVLAGVAYALFYQLPRYYATADTWRFYRLSISEKEWLLRNPVRFLKDIVTHGYNQTGNVFIGSNSYWNDLKSNLIIKLMAVFNVFTASNYYSNILLFNMLFFIGLIGLYRVFTSLYPRGKWAAIVGIFMFPSTLFWCSGIHKDGLILSATGLIVYLVYFKILKQVSNVKTWLVILFCLGLIFALRSYVALALIPFLAGWWVSTTYKWPSLQVFMALYFVGIGCFFLLPYLSPTLNFPAFLANKQFEFSQLSGGSAVAVPVLQPGISGFAAYLPVALDMAFLQPHIGAGLNMGTLLSFAEQLLVIILLLMFWKFRTPAPNLSIFTGMLFFGFSLLLIAGYTVTFSGAIIRYRSFVIPFLITPMLCRINVKKLSDYVTRATN